MSYEAWGEPPDCYCEMCGNECSSCICDECPVCEEFGNPKCYEEHGLVETEEQVQSRIRNSPCDDDYW
jgi:hypothetical protein